MLDSISRSFSDIIRHLSGKASITEKNIQEAVEQIKVALLEADVNLRVVRRFVNRTIEEATGEKVLRSVDPGQQFVKIVYDRMVQLLGTDKPETALKGPDTLSVVLMMGLQGSGKTTTAAKLAAFYKRQGRKPLLAAADLVRPAAIQQLSLLGGQAGVEVYAEETRDPLQVVRGARSYAKKKLFDTLIIDTAGRLHIDEDLMKELSAVRRVAEPDEVLFVADAMTGQHAVDIAMSFDEKIGISGVILTKFDSDTRGGAAISLKEITGKPIRFIGTGEKLSDLELFHPERIASRILGMGDIVSLVEKAQETINEEEARALQDKIEQSTFTLEDYLDQFRRLKKMGSIQSVLKMIPGAQDIDEDRIDEQEMRREEAIICSMTSAERKNERIIGPSRRKRIAMGSGTSVYDVNRLLKKFDKMKLTMRKMTKNKKYQAKMLSQLGGQS